MAAPSNLPQMPEKEGMQAMDSPMPVTAANDLAHQGINPTCFAPLPPGPSALPATQRAQLLRCRANDPERETLERFARRSFHSHHGACAVDFLPTLLGLTDSKGSVIATVGYGGCGVEPVFLEQYLPLPVQRHIERHCGLVTERHKVVEIGNLAARNSYWAHQLFCKLADDLSEQGFQWAVFTATRQVRRIFSAIGIELVQLGVADPHQIALAGQNWGSYYDNTPRVMAGCIAKALPRFQGIDRSGRAQ